LKRSNLICTVTCLVAATCLVTAPTVALGAVPGIPVEAKTLDIIVLDVKAPLNRKLDELRRTYGIRETKAGGFHFIDRNNNVVMTVETHRSLNSDSTQRVEEFLYRNRQQRLILQEKVITHGESLSFHNFEERLFQTGVENYDLESTEQTLKIATMRMGGALFKVVSSRERNAAADIKRHQISVGESQQLEIRDTIYPEANYRTYEYEVLDPQFAIFAFGRPTFGVSPWLGTFRIGVRTATELLLPEVTYEKIGTDFSKGEVDDRGKLNGFESFSGELHERLITPFVEKGAVQAIKGSVATQWVWPASRSMQSIGSESKFLNELIVIRNEVSQAKSNPAVLSLVEVKINVFIRDIQAGALKINDFR